MTRGGTGKTYASAFALKNEKPKKALFIVHREIIAKQAIKSYQKVGSIIFLMGLASNVLGYRHPAAILDRSKNKCCGLITDGEELKNNQLCFSVDTTVLHLFSDLSRTCPRTSGGWIPPLALTPKNNRSVSFLVA